MSENFLIFGIIDNILTQGFIHNEICKPYVFEVITSDGIKLKCQSSFIKAYDVGDNLYGVVRKIGDICDFLQEPFTYINTDIYYLKQTLIKALRQCNGGFGSKNADIFYDKIEEMIRTENLIKSSPTFEQLLNGYMNKNPETKTQITSLDVSNYLTKLAIDYKKKELKTNTIERLENTTQLKATTIKKLLNWWYEKRHIRKLYLLGLDRSEIYKCEMDLDEIYKICVENPFKLPAIPLIKCENICKTIPITVTSEHLTCGQIIRSIYDNVNNFSWTCTPVWLLRKNFKSYYTYYDDLIQKYDVVECCECLYLKKQYDIETYVVEYIDEILKTKPFVHPSTICENEEEPIFPTSSTITDEQKESIRCAFKNNITFITGGPGTGKSTLIRILIDNFHVKGIKFKIVSFTGKAVSRINNIVKMNVATTIHRLLAHYNESIEFSYMIIDEISMVSTELFYMLIKTIPFKFRIIMIGDINQLQPISWGSLMKGLLGCDRIPICYLTENFRVKKTESDQGIYDRYILKNANSIINPRNTEGYPITFEQGNGFNIVQHRKESIKAIIQGYKNANIKETDITVISPFNEHIDEINDYFRQIYFPSNNFFTDSKREKWYVGARAMMTKNNYDIGVMNGEEGIVTEINDTGITVSFDQSFHVKGNNPEVSKNGIFFEYSKNTNWTKNQGNNFTEKGEALDTEYDPDWDKLTTSLLRISFCCTVEKCQGSEQRIVILYVPKREKPSKFLNLNRLYTSITRAREFVFIVSEDENTLKHYATTRPGIRYENLTRRLFQLSDQEKEKEVFEYNINQRMKYEKLFEEEIIRVVDNMNDEDAYFQEEFDFY